MYYTRNYDDKKSKFAIADTKIYLPVSTLSAQENAKILRQLKTGFKIAINWNTYQSESTLQTRNGYLNYSIDPRFQGVNRLFVLSFENDEHRRRYKLYFLPTVEIKDYNVMIDGKNVFDQPVKNDLITHENIRKIATGQCLHDWLFPRLKLF